MLHPPEQSELGFLGVFATDLKFPNLDAPKAIGVVEFNPSPRKLKSFPSLQSDRRNSAHWKSQTAETQKWPKNVLEKKISEPSSPF